MGNDSSQPISVLVPLETEDLAGKKEFFEQLFDPKNAESYSKNGISKIFIQYFKQKPDNFIELLKQSVDSLSACLNKTESEQNEKIDIKSQISVFSLLRLILPLLINSSYGHQKLSEPYKDEKSLGYCLFSLSTKIFNQCDSFDNFSLIVIECIIMLIRCSFDVKDDPEKTEDFKILVNKLKDNVKEMLINYHKSKANDKKSTQKSILLMLVFLELVEDNIILNDAEKIKEEKRSMFSLLVQNITKQSGIDELKTLFLPLVFQLYFNYMNIIEKETKTDEETDFVENTKYNSQLLINLLHLVDVNGKNYISRGCFYALSLFLSMDPIKKCLNIPCTSFESSTPVHRGSICDILIEIAYRNSVVNPSILHSCVDCISTALPHASNISYVSAVSIINLILKGNKLKDEYVIDNLIKAIHFSINSSIRENVPLVIVLLKNSKMFIQMSKVRTSFEELNSIVTFAKNVNQELKQMGTTFKSAELESFFQDPACEHFANPVLKPPEQNFINNTNYMESIYCIIDSYISKEILGINEVISIPEVSKDAQ